MKKDKLALCLILLTCTIIVSGGDNPVNESTDIENNNASGSVPVLQSDRSGADVSTLSTLASTLLREVDGPNISSANSVIHAIALTTPSNVKKIEDGNYLAGLKPGTFKRMLYVLVGISSIVILYFAVKAVRLRNRASRVRQYGMLSRDNKQDVEMSPLESDGEVDDEDEDTTLFDKSITSGRK